METIKDPILKILLEYAVQDENIRGVLMEGSRAFGAVDTYSDYDVVFVTASSEPYFNGAILPFFIEQFGEIAVMQTPDNGDPRNVYTHLMQFSNGLRIDLTFNSIDFLSWSPMESATTVLLDKDGRFAQIPPSSDADFWLKMPDKECFLEHCNQFWWVAPYVPKAVARGQMLHALEIMSERIRPEYRVMLSYLAGARNRWKEVNPGKHCTDIHRLLPEDEIHYYQALLDSYVPAQGERVCGALDLLMSKYHSLAALVADALGYTYDVGEGQRTMDFIQNRYKS